MKKIWFKSDLLKFLKELRRQKTISEFTKIDGPDTFVQRLTYRLKLVNYPKNLVIHCQEAKGKLSEGISRIIEEASGEITIAVWKGAKSKTIFQEIREAIKKRKKGFSFEKLAYNDFSKLKNDPNSLVKEVLWSTKEQDMAGGDLVIIPNMGSKFFLQLKTDVREFNFFKSKHPNIPLLLYDKNLYEEGLLSSMIQFIIEGMAVGRVEHVKRDTLQHISGYRQKQKICA